MRILFTGGGTGGHIYPLLAVKEKLDELGKREGQSIESYYLGAPGMFSGLLESAGMKIYRILPVKIRRYFDVRNLIAFPKLGISLLQAVWRMFLIMPDVVFSKGGPGALESVFAARFFRIPVVIHESDTVPGAANRLSATKAKVIAIAFASATSGFKANVQDKIVITGNPIRGDLLSHTLDPKSAKRIFGLNDAEPTILVIGGSQGAEKINEMILDVLPELLDVCQIIHVCGILNYERTKNDSDFILKNNPELAEKAKRYKLLPYLEENYAAAFSAADVVISRAGSGSIFEIAALGKPSIIIPLANSAYDHQLKNAYEYAGSGAAVVIEQENLTRNIFLSQVNKLLMDENLRNTLSAAGKIFAKPEAAEIIAKEIFNLGK